MTTSLENIKDKVEEYYSISDLKDKSRISDVVEARRMFCYYARKHALKRNGKGYSFRKISEFLGIHHSTIIHHVNVIDAWVKYQDKAILKDIWNLFELNLAKKKDIFAESNPKSFESFLFYLKQVPEDKLPEALERVRAIAKGYNMIHGKENGKVYTSGGVDFVGF